MKHSVQYGTSLIQFDLEYADRKTLGIKVHPDKRVQVIAPIESKKDKINKKVKSKASWILKQQEFFLSFHPLTPSRKYISGETHLYLGKQYRLKLKQSKEESVKLVGGNIVINCHNKNDNRRLKVLLKDWYKRKANYHFNLLFNKWIKASNSVNHDELQMKCKWMTKRWGSCNKKGDITLNLELIKAPKNCIEYVIVHEMCHLTYLNHSKDYYKLLENKFPEWRKAKNKLEHFMA